MQVGFPMIVKPLAGAGSQGVYIARDKDQLMTTYVQLEAEVKANKFLAYVSACLLSTLLHVGACLSLASVSGSSCASLIVKVLIILLHIYI